MPSRSAYRWVGGITRAELSAGLRAAARGAAKNGNVEQARALRAHAARARETVMRDVPRRAVSWPRPERAPSIWSLAKSAARTRRDLAKHRKRERRERVAHTRALQLGGRTLLAMSCWRCGKFLPGDKFKRHIRNAKDGIDYIDRRCVNCKWGTRVNGKRERPEHEA